VNFSSHISVHMCTNHTQVRSSVVSSFSVYSDFNRFGHPGGS